MVESDFVKKKLIHVHDNSGHAFSMQLSHEIARRGIAVLHTSMLEFQSPKGALSNEDSDSKNLRIEQLTLGKHFPKYSFVRRWLHERAFGRMLAKKIAAERPDVFIACNVPLDLMLPLQKICRKKGIRFVFWLQDIYSKAMLQILPKRYGTLGRCVAFYYEFLEKKLLRRSDVVVAISEGFGEFLREAQVEKEAIHHIPNWASASEIAPKNRNNSWRAENELGDNFIFLYSGTLGLKHNPELLIQLASHYKKYPDVLLVVVSEGLGADWLVQKKKEKEISNMLVLPFQPYSRLTEVLSAADVTIALLEPEAGVYSVPSKILSYLCAGRPVLLSAPPENQSSLLIQRCHAGFLSPAGNADDFLELSYRLYSDEKLRVQMGRNGREYAENNFSIQKIADRFETALAIS